MIAAMRYARWIAVLAPIAALVFLGWHYMTLTREGQEQAVMIEALTIQVRQAQQDAAATIEAANAEIEQAQEILHRERAAAGKLRTQLDRIAKASGQCLDTKLPKGIITP